MENNQKEILHIDGELLGGLVVTLGQLRKIRSVETVLTNKELHENFQTASMELAEEVNRPVRNNEEIMRLAAIAAAQALHFLTEYDETEVPS